MRRLLILCLYVCLVHAGKRKSGETKYGVLYQNTVSSCQDFTNEVVDAAGLNLNDEDNSLEGSLSIGKELADGVNLNLEIYKYNDENLELLATIKTDLCSAIKETDAPWSPVFQQLGIEECPISVMDLTIERLVLDTSFADDFMSNEYVADYFVTLIFTRISDDAKEGEITLVCYNLPLSIFEYKEGDDDEE